MQISNDAHWLKDVKARDWTKESMQADFRFEIAEKLTASLFEKGLISEQEKEKISRLNREKFHPFYKELLG
nr:MAG TPA: hypothetical protein [Caudoviricetes sp.]